MSIDLAFGTKHENCKEVVFAGIWHSGMSVLLHEAKPYVSPRSRYIYVVFEYGLDSGVR